MGANPEISHLAQTTEVCSRRRQGVLPKPPIGPSGRASVPASPDFFDFPDKYGLAGTLALPGQGLGNTPGSRR